jgi:hypothetical protein
MNDSAQVHAVKDDMAPRQWGRNPFLFLDGKKRSVHRRTFKFALLGASVILILVQCLFGGEIRNVATPTPIGMASISVAENSVQLPTIGAETVRAPQRSGTVAKTHSYSGPQVVLRPRHLKSIPAGTMADAILLTGASNGLVRARLTTAVSIGGHTEIDSGSLLVGTGTSSEDRLFVQFNQVTFSDGTVGEISAQACDAEDRIVGLKGAAVGTKAVNIGGSIGLGLIGGLAEGLQETRGEHGVVVRPPSLENGLLNAVSRTALEQSQHLMSDLKGRKPVIEVSAGERICVIWGDR